MPLKSFIDVPPNSHSPLENLPFGIFKPQQGAARIGVAIGEVIVELSALEELGHFGSPEFQDRRPFSQDSLNVFLALGQPAWRKAPGALQHLLDAEAPALRNDTKLRERGCHRVW